MELYKLASLYEGTLFVSVTEDFHRSIASEIGTGTFKQNHTETIHSVIEIT